MTRGMTIGIVGVLTRQQTHEFHRWSSMSCTIHDTGAAELVDSLAACQGECMKQRRESEEAQCGAL